MSELSSANIAAIVLGAFGALLSLVLAIYQLYEWVSKKIFLPPKKQPESFFELQALRQYYLDRRETSTNLFQAFHLCVRLPGEPILPLDTYRYNLPLVAKLILRCKRDETLLSRRLIEIIETLCPRIQQCRVIQFEYDETICKLIEFWKIFRRETNALSGQEADHWPRPPVTYPGIEQDQNQVENQQAHPAIEAALEQYCQSYQQTLANAQRIPNNLEVDYAELIQGSLIEDIQQQAKVQSPSQFERARQTLSPKLRDFIIYSTLSANTRDNFRRVINGAAPVIHVENPSYVRRAGNSSLMYMCGCCFCSGCCSRKVFDCNEVTRYMDT